MSHMTTVNRKTQDFLIEQEEFLILDDVLIARAADKDQIPLLCFPNSERGIVDYDEFTGQDVDRMVDHAVRQYIRIGLQPHQSKGGEPPVIALIGPTDLSYIITFFALSRLGYTSLCLSPRLAPDACAKLIEETGAFGLISRPTQMLDLINEIQQLLKTPAEIFQIIRREQFDKPDPGSRFQRDVVDREIERNWTVAILHSSGSTGLPKPIYIPHKREVMKVPPPNGQTEFCTFPFFHGYGHWVVTHGMMDRKTLYMYNVNLPITADYCTKVLENIRPDVLHVVPYTLELLALSDRGLDAMLKCQRVVFSGSGCPDDTGHDLVAKGVNLETMWGATEMGALGSSFNRAPGDASWDYIRIPPHIAKFIWMRPLGDDTYECVFLQGLPTLVVSNSNDPPGSFHSSDIFVKHPDMVAWKHIGRLDDRITLINGEKVLPVPMEGRIRLDPLIRQCCIFGTGRSIPGILIFRNEESKDIADNDFIGAIWSVIQNANMKAESFSHISKEAIITLSAEADYPKTDKESIKRAQVYRTFSKEIDDMYDRIENSAIGRLQFEPPKMENWLLATIDEELGVSLPDSQYDFFAAGINSLQAIQMRGLILKHIDIGGNSQKLGRNVLFDNANVARLAKHLHALRLNMKMPEDGHNAILEMKTMIKKHSTFKAHVPGSIPTTEGHVIVLTGATGSLGAHLLAQLLCHPKVKHVYCLVRGENPQRRVLSALRQRSLNVPNDESLTVLQSDLSKSDLGLSQERCQELKKVVTMIIHSAWAVHFNLGIGTFEDQHIAGVSHLIQLSLSVQTAKPARLFFCSSIAAALGTPAPATIPEGPIHNLNYALPQGYARSKLVSEHIIHKAAIDIGARTRIFRIGQIVGDRKQGIWTSTEAIPLIIRSALTLKALPALDQKESWLPVDTLASTILDLAGITAPLPAADTNKDLVYNLQNPHTFSWTHDLLPALADAGIAFSTVPADEWLEKLRDYDKSGKDPEENPAVKLIDHFEGMYAGEQEKERKAQIEFEISTAIEHSRALKEAPDVAKDGYVRKFVENWWHEWVVGKSLGAESSG